MAAKSINLCFATLFICVVIEGLSQGVSAYKDFPCCGGEPEMREWAKDRGETCRHFMSEETAELFDDNEEYDNLEVRKFLVCLYQNCGHFDNGQFIARVIGDDINYFFTDEVIRKQLKVAVNFCIDNELPDSTEDTDLVAAYTKCLNDKKKSDM